jgi:hypothetical protein
MRRGYRLFFHKRLTLRFQIHGHSPRPFLALGTVAGIDVEVVEGNAELAHPTQAASFENMHGVLLYYASQTE